MTRTAGIAALIASTGIATAQISFFTDEATWAAAAGGPVALEDFNGASLGSFTDSAVVLSTFTISHSSDGTSSVAGFDPGSNFGNLDGTTFVDATTGPEPGGTLTITFDTAVNAFGADFFSPFSGAGIDLLIDGESFALDHIAGFDQGFAGVVSTTAFTQIQMVGNYDNGVFQELYSFDNVRSVVPAPSALAVAGLGGLVAVRRRR